jgi:tetratricopeptide (TPR) repeat protein
MVTHYNDEYIELVSKLKEADTCHSMGLYDEALSIYHQTLSLIPDHNNQRVQIIQNKIFQIQQELSELEKTERREFSSEDFSTIKNTLPNDDEVSSIVDRTVSLKELGLLEEATVEYEKLLQFDFGKSDYSKLDYSPAQIVVDYLTCLLETKPAKRPSKPRKSSKRPIRSFISTI